MSGSAAIFREEQKFRLMRQRMLLAIPPVGMTLLVIWQVILGHPWGRQPMSNKSVIGWTIFLWLVYLRLVTVRLVTEVRAGELAVAMRGLWRARRIPLSEIKSAKTVNYDPARDYGGSGIRTTRSGTAYIAGGDRGVRLELSKGGTVLIGSERPEELVSAIKGYATRVSSA
ncbi:MAG TPA: hypothetical protein VK335_19200 [Bryobacteraceae bacterium]|nr:hypothetical protein [Bryobacteraceae bacterium]